MRNTLTNFAAQQGLFLSTQQAETLVAYARCVWEKKDFLNLTSAATFEEVICRHICDGLIAAATLQKQCTAAPSLQLADVGAGCGYIGLTVAVALPHAHVTLVESIEKRCKFMNWAALTAGIANITVKNARLGQGTRFHFDGVTERAMGQLPDIFNSCMDAVKPGGIFVAFQGAHPQAVSGHSPAAQIPYALPGDNTPRYLLLFKKVYA